MADFKPTYRAEIDNMIIEGKINGKPIEFVVNSFVGHKDSAAGIVGGYMRDPAQMDIDPDYVGKPFAYEFDLPPGFDASVTKGGQFRAGMAADQIQSMDFDAATIHANRINLPAGTDDFEGTLKERLATSHAEKIKSADIKFTHGEGNIDLGGEVSAKGPGQFGHIDTESGRFAQATEFMGDAAKRLGGTAGVFAGAVAGGMVLMDGGSLGEAYAATGDIASVTVDAVEGNYWGIAQTAAEAAGGAVGMTAGMAVGSAVPLGGTLAGGGAGMVAGMSAGVEIVVEAASFGSGDFRERLQGIELPPNAHTQFSDDFIKMVDQAKYIAHMEAQDYAGRETNEVLPDFMSEEFAALQEKMIALDDAKEGFENMYGQARIEGTLNGLHTQLAAAENMTPSEATQTAEFTPETPVVNTSTSLKM